MFDSRGWVGQFFLQEFVFAAKEFAFFFSFCFVPLCTIFISSVEAVRNFGFIFASPRKKKRWSVNKQLCLLPGAHGSCYDWTWTADCSLQFLWEKNTCVFGTKMQLNGVSSDRSQ